MAGKVSVVQASVLMCRLLEKLKYLQNSAKTSQPCVSFSERAAKQFLHFTWRRCMRL